MASKEQLRKVAMYCNEYRPVFDTSFSSSTSHFEETKSCKNCEHFTESGFCDINLVDKILSSLSMELGKK
ncbi:hypothetical protein [Anaerosalibacter sp. Marseille-P3206]|uniref:hypothetical protein n=1 Tax=Anaerosalibacter sp. Marseille-P3206 TaxID=1871005 RepID=UPI000987AA03|nr:hypothetical protein [Anaerosalibacter sp. Marseille-P3206]